MKKIVVFKEEESKIIEAFEKILEKNKKLKEIKKIKKNSAALKELARSISLYPSILKEQHLGSATRSVKTLVESMCENNVEDINLNIPTKAVLGAGFLIAKINFFYMMLYLSKEIKKTENITISIKTFISNNIFTLMAEDVFLSIIEDYMISMKIRLKAGYLIANIWEYRLDHGVKAFTPILSDIWIAREKLIPAYGAMLGISELYKISHNIEPIFLDFIRRDGLSDEEIASMEEFIFGLTYEETSKLRKEMKKRKISVITKEDVEKIIGQNRIYPEYRVTDQREIYRSFKHRKSNAKYRARAGLKGPRKTIEEYIMCYLLSRASE